MRFVCVDVTDGVRSGPSRVVSSLTGNPWISQNSAVLPVGPFSAQQGTICKRIFIFLINERMFLFLSSSPSPPFSPSPPLSLSSSLPFSHHDVHVDNRGQLEGACSLLLTSGYRWALPPACKLWLMVLPLRFISSQGYPSLSITSSGFWLWVWGNQTQVLRPVACAESSDCNQDFLTCIWVPGRAGASRCIRSFPRDLIFH